MKESETDKNYGVTLYCIHRIMLRNKN